MKMWLGRSYEEVNGVKIYSIEDWNLRIGSVILHLRWRSAEDGRTPYWCLNLWWNGRTLIDWTIYNPNRLKNG
jgi:hypothetical protein